MTETINSSADSHLSVATTTAKVTDQTQTLGGITAISSGVDFYFQCAVIVIGVVGAAANALVLYAMVASKQHKKQLLIFNQNVFDLCSCVLLVITYTLKLCNVRVTDTFTYWLCMMFMSESLLWSSINGSVINLLSITVDRYLKAFPRDWSKKFLLSKCAIMSTIVFAWISSAIQNMAVVFSTTRIIDGVCYGYMFWKSRVAEVIYAIWYFMSFFVVEVFIFVYCYGRIVAVIRRQASVMADHQGPGTSAAQAHTLQVQTNVIKTMILISAFYIVTWMPTNVNYLILNFNEHGSSVSIVHYTATFVSFLYICANPFIYATKFDPVKRILVDLIPSMIWRQFRVDSYGT